MPLDQWNNWLPWIHFLRSVLDFYSTNTRKMKGVASLVEQGEVVPSSFFSAYHVVKCLAAQIFDYFSMWKSPSQKVSDFIESCCNLAKVDFLDLPWMPSCWGKKTVEPCWTILGGLTLQSSFLFTSVKGPSHLHKSSIHRLPMFSCWSFGHLLRCLCTCAPWPNQLKNLGQ